MPKLFVEKTIEINAPAYKVWDVLTSREYTAQWAPESETSRRNELCKQ